MRTQPILALDPSVYCISTSNPLSQGHWPIQMPTQQVGGNLALGNRGETQAANSEEILIGKREETLAGNRGESLAGNREENLAGNREERLAGNHDVDPDEDQKKIPEVKNRKNKYAPPSFFETLPLASHLRRVDHFVVGGATLVPRPLLEEVLTHFTLPVVPTTRSFPRPSDFVPYGTPFPPDGEEGKETEQTKENKYNNGNLYDEYKKFKLREAEMSGGNELMKQEFNIMVEVADWLSWSSHRLLRGCVVPATPRSCLIRHLESQDTSKDNEDSRRCALPGVDQVPLVEPENMVRYRYYQHLYGDMTRAQYLGTVPGTACTDPGFYPEPLKA
ncbi:uncharacterized protein LOC108676916, partial [Hyalella azteca]|uniref:Uncharacterized protein LOC108676916 n=1 Tax=Hyalella azteca TaxID=294128 RepID=A0A8B7P3E4_HYAAZ